MYRIAEQHEAFYSPDRTQSIYYESDSDDLQIALVFRNETLAYKFHACLAQLYLNNPTVKLGDISVRPELEVVSVPKVSNQHYVA